MHGFKSGSSVKVTEKLVSRFDPIVYEFLRTYINKSAILDKSGTEKVKVIEWSQWKYGGDWKEERDRMRSDGKKAIITLLLDEIGNKSNG